MDSVMRAATFVEKGGVGKTTSAAHIAVAAATDHELDVLLIDLAGTQNDLATQFGFDGIVDDVDAPISAVFGDDWEFIKENIPDIADRMTFETDEGPDLIPADPGLGGADNNLANVPREERYDKLDAFISEQIAPRYDLVVLDLPGKEDNIAVNGLFAAEDIVTPLRPGEFERQQLDNLHANLEEIRDEYPVNPRVALVIPTMVDRTTNLSEQFVAELQETFPDTATNPVAATANIGNEQAVGQTLFALADDDLYSTGRRAREAYQHITVQLLDSLEAR